MRWQIGHYQWEITAPDACAPLGLSSREFDVLSLLSHGHGQKAIARMLGISIHTVDAHLRRIYRKLGVQSSTAAVAIFVASFGERTLRPVQPAAQRKCA